MSYDPTALATLLRSTGKTAIQIAALMRANRPAHINKDASSQKVDAWIRGKSLPRDEVRGWLADALNIPRPTLYAACAGETGPTDLAPALAAIDAEIEGNDSVPVIRALGRVRARIAGLSDA